MLTTATHSLVRFFCTVTSGPVFERVPLSIDALNNNCVSAEIPAELSQFSQNRKGSIPGFIVTRTQGPLIFTFNDGTSFVQSGIDLFDSSDFLMSAAMIKVCSTGVREVMYYTGLRLNSVKHSPLVVRDTQVFTKQLTCDVSRAERASFHDEDLRPTSEIIKLFY